MKTAIAIRHLAFEDLGSFALVLEGAGYRVRCHDIGLDEPGDLRELDPDLLIVLGGPIGAYEDEVYPFLCDEIALLERRLAVGRATLGICLGAQLMARALDARVYPGGKEIGFAPLDLTEEGRASCLAVLEGGPVLHWHGDTFDLPQGAVRLASTPVCENQAFALGRHVLALQFHPEVGTRGFERWLIGHTLELAHAGRKVMELREDLARHAPELERRGAACLQAWLGQIEA